MTLEKIRVARMSYHAQVGSLTWATLCFPSTESFLEACNTVRDGKFAIWEEFHLAEMQLAPLKTKEDYMAVLRSETYPRILGLPCVVDTSVSSPCIKAAAIYLPDRVPVVVAI